MTALRVSDDPFWVAIALLEHAEWLADRGQTDEIAPLVAESRATFEQLRVPPMLERVATLERLAVPNLEAALDG